MLGRTPRLPPFPYNDLERTLVVARTSGDDLKLLRALARDVVCLAQPGPGPEPGRPEFRTVPAHERLLPVAEGRDGRTWLLAFTSGPSLFRYYEGSDQVWAQTPAGQLFDTLPPDVPVFLNPGSPDSVVLEPADVRTVADLWLGRNVAAAFTPGPATELLLGEPSTEPVDLLAAVSRVAGRHPAVLSAHRGLARLDEPDARFWWLLGLRLDPAADDAARGALRDELAAAVEAATADFVEMRVLPDPPEPGVEEWLAGSDPFYVRP